MPRWQNRHAVPSITPGCWSRHANGARCRGCKGPFGPSPNSRIALNIQRCASSGPISRFSPTRQGITDFLDRRRAMGMKRLDRLPPPRLALLAFLLGPHDRLPVRREDQAGAGVGDFDPVAAGVADIEEEGLLERVLGRAGFDIDPVLEKNVGGAQNLFAAVERVGDVVKAAHLAEMVAW